MSFGHALYYPYIHLLNTRWLKHSFLYWDRISRIVPPNFKTRDNEVIRMIQEETNFLNDYHPEQEDVNSAFIKFINSFKYLPENSRTLISFHIEYSHFFNSSRFSEPPTHEPSMKIEIEQDYLVNMVGDQGLVLTRGNKWSNLIRINSDFGSLYMRYLADIIATKKSIPLVTNTEEYYASQELPFNDGYQHKFEQKLGCLLIDTVFPKNIDNVTFEQLINIRNKYDDQRIRYFNNINELSSTLPSIDSESALKDALHYYKTILVNDTNDLKKIYESNGIEAMIKPMSISMPTAIASLSELVSAEYKALGVGIGLLYGVVSYYNELKKSQREVQKNPMSYLLSIDSELNKQDLFNRLLNRLSGSYK